MNAPLTVSVGKHLEVREAPEGTFGPIIARLAGPADDEGQRQYATLFAASPDLLLALKVLTGPWLGKPDEQIQEEYGSLGVAAYQQARDAISKAEARS